MDGITDGSWGGNTVTHTGMELDPWWEVDLGSVEPISRIVIFNRTDGELEDRLSDFLVTLYDNAHKWCGNSRSLRPQDPASDLIYPP